MGYWQATGFKEIASKVRSSSKLQVYCCRLSTSKSDRHALQFGAPVVSRSPFDRNCYELSHTPGLEILRGTSPEPQALTYRILG